MRHELVFLCIILKVIIDDQLPLSETHQYYWQQTANKNRIIK